MSLKKLFHPTGIQKSIIFACGLSCSTLNKFSEINVLHIWLLAFGWLFHRLIYKLIYVAHSSFTNALQRLHLIVLINTSSSVWRKWYAKLKLWEGIPIKVGLGPIALKKRSPILFMGTWCPENAHQTAVQKVCRVFALLIVIVRSFTSSELIQKASNVPWSSLQKQIDNTIWVAHFGGHVFKQVSCFCIL